MKKRWYFWTTHSSISVCSHW